MRRAIQSINRTDGESVESVQRRQSDALRNWADANGRLIDHQAFTDAWNDQTTEGGERVMGTEQQVLFQQDLKCVQKRKVLWPDETWQDYLNRLEAHKLHFPDTAYTFYGFTDAPYSKGSAFMARVSQPFSERLRHATEEEIRTHLEAKGFSSFEDTKMAALGVTGFKFLKWRHRETGHVVGDLGPNNIWFDTSGKVAVVDPSIDTPSIKTA